MKLTSSLGEVLGRDKRLFPGEIYWSGTSGHLRVLATDLNRDGAVDMVAAGYGQTALHFNNGKGDFSRVQLLDVRAPTQMLVSDINRDGNPDLITLDFEGGLFTHLGTATGSFSSAGPFRSSGLLSIITADLNNDSHPDVLASDRTGFVLFASNADGSLALLASLEIGTPEAMAAADVTADGNVDLVWAPSNESVAKVAPGDGNGRFGDAVTLQSPRGTVRTLLAADIDLDGQTDIVAGLLAPELAFWAGLGGGRFKDAQAIELGGSGRVDKLSHLDLDGDGSKELAVQRAPDYPPNYRHLLAVKLSNSGAPQVRTVFEGESIFPAEWADVNADGQADAVFPNSEGVLLFLATPAGSLAHASRLEPENRSNFSTPAFREHLAVGDIDGDGVADFADQRGGVFFGSPAGSLSQTTLPDAPITGWLGTDVALADLDRDRDLDLLISLGSNVTLTGNVVRVFLQGTGRSFSRYGDFPVAAAPTYMEAADFDGDQQPDLVTLSRPSADSTLTLLFGKGDGGLQNREDLPLPKVAGRTLVPRDLFVGDVTGDGAVDILVVSWALSHYTSYVTVFQNTGSNPVFVPHPPLALGNKRSEGVFTIGDFNRDHQSDIVVQQSGPSYEMAVFLCDGSGGFKEGPIRAAHRSASFLQTEDLDRDGALDLLALERDSLTCYFGNSTGGFPFTRSFFAGYDPWYAATADLNDDGWPEIVAQRGQHLTVIPHNGLSTDVMMFRALKQTLQPGPEAERIRQVFASHEEEIIRIVAIDWAEELRRRLRELLAKLLPALIARASGQPSSITMTVDMVAEANALLNELSNKASPELKTVLASERARVNQLNEFAGDDVSEVLARYFREEELRIWAAGFREGAFRLVVNGALSGAYGLLRTLSLVPAAWNKIPAITGQVEDSKPVLIDPNPPPGPVFYRVQKEGP